MTTATMLLAPIAAAQPVVRLFELQTDPARAQVFDVAGRDNMQASLRDEPGVLAMHAVASLSTPGLAYVLELYADQAAYRRHVETAHYRRFLESTRSLVTDKRLVEIDPMFLAEQPAALSILQRGRTPEARIVEVTVKREDLAQFHRIVTKEMRKSMQVEPGVLAMYAATRKGRPDQWIFFEIYADAAAYASHRQTPHFKDYLRLTGDMLVEKSHVEVENIALQSRGGLRFDPPASD
ncbi:MULTISPECIES: antibiotic biosynthesis monooxygenase [Xanthomonas]|uniref:Antibiotic biosynthesis monooxygenase n=1 Tax=Xanthomonas dyei TaxID=743699 RepID=A0ABZ0D7I9_9XANT|nr:antibiotic biosynthesis monooxygenase [Xanthomonas dyei]WOB24512.1 antibiotic biosynthesis monooxygenase [Xanthomonas dyei]WOB52140.1 antibiotic biosynthesis monooxygenase [Xanthomonas dyei]